MDSSSGGGANLEASIKAQTGTRMADGAHELMSHLSYAEMLVSKALEFNQQTKIARKVRNALLLVAISELRAEIAAMGGSPRHQSE